MRFFNRYILLFTAVVSVWTALFYAALMYLLRVEAYVSVGAISFAYGLGIFLAGRFIGRRDPYNGYFGFNYHFMTYVVCNAAAWITQEYFDHTGGALSMTLTWGIGVLVHFIFWMVGRKRSLRGFDKDELFE